jgi:hypothetical protein
LYSACTSGSKYFRACFYVVGWLSVPSSRIGCEFYCSSDSSSPVSTFLPAEPLSLPAESYFLEPSSDLRALSPKVGTEFL